MTGTTDKPVEAPTQPAETAPPPLAPEKPADPAPSRLFWPSPKTVRHVVIEVLIVAVGVLLALGIDQLRQHFGRLAQAQETRELLRAEMQRNSAAVQEGMKGVAEVYRQIDTAPEELVDLRALSRSAEFGIPSLVDAAYSVALQTGTFAYLDSRERSTISEAYRILENHDLRANEYWGDYRNLAGYPVGTMDSAEEARERSREIRRFQTAGRILFTVQCRQMVRINVVLEESWTGKTPREYCRGVDPRTSDIDALIAGKGVVDATPVVPQTAAPN